MKKNRSQIAVGIVCILLGFMIAYQLKSIAKQRKSVEQDTNVAQITLEIEQLKKQKESMEKKINELQTEIK
ncbi:MAG: dihydropteridine reductase, partial [Clostridiaceae bacterium]